MNGMRQTTRNGAPTTHFLNEAPLRVRPRAAAGRGVKEADSAAHTAPARAPHLPRVHGGAWRARREALAGLPRNGGGARDGAVRAAEHGMVGRGQRSPSPSLRAARRSGGGDREALRSGNGCSQACLSRWEGAEIAPPARCERKKAAPADAGAA